MVVINKSLKPTSSSGGGADELNEELQKQLL